MKKAKFQLEKFQSDRIETLEADQLKLIVGAKALAAQCSTTGDTDSKSDGCSDSNDIDNDSTPEQPVPREPIIIA